MLRRHEIYWRSIRKYAIFQYPISLPCPIISVVIYISAVKSLGKKYRNLVEFKALGLINYVKANDPPLPRRNIIFNRKHILFFFLLTGTVYKALITISFIKCILFLARMQSLQSTQNIKYCLPHPFAELRTQCTIQQKEHFTSTSLFSSYFNIRHLLQYLVTASKLQ